MRITSENVRLRIPISISIEKDLNVGKTLSSNILSICLREVKETRFPAVSEAEEAEELI